MWGGGGAAQRSTTNLQAVSDAAGNNDNISGNAVYVYGSSLIVISDVAHGGGGGGLLIEWNVFRSFMCDVSRFSVGITPELVLVELFNSGRRINLLIGDIPARTMTIFNVRNFSILDFRIMAIRFWFANGVIIFALLYTHYLFAHLSFSCVWCPHLVTNRNNFFPLLLANF